MIRRKKEKDFSMLNRDLRYRQNPQEIINAGSDTFQYSVPSIAHGATAWFEVETLFPKARQFFPLDSLEIVNDTMCLLTIYLNSPKESYIQPASMIKTLNKPFRRVGIKNNDPANAAANITLHMRRLARENTVRMVQG